MFFGQNFNNFWQNWILIFCCTTSVGMLFMVIKKNPWKVLGDMARTRKRYTRLDRRTDGLTDGRTDIHRGKNNICLPVGRHIIIGKSGTRAVHFKRCYSSAFIWLEDFSKQTACWENLKNAAVKKSKYGPGNLKYFYIYIEHCVHTTT